MAWIASDPGSFVGQVVQNGHCVRYVQLASGAPHTSRWRRGAKVRGHPDIRYGTVIATFDPLGTYGNHTDGRSHAAIFVRHDPEGIRVWDQWVGHPVAQRVIRYRGGQGRAVNDGDQFFIVEGPEPETASAAA
jgi:hypothetical protein